VSPLRGTIDVGFRGRNVDGDEARFERYRDMRNGANVNFAIGQQTDTFAFSAGAQNIGYRDGRYALDYARSKLNVGFVFDMLPLNFAYNTFTPWREDISGDVARLRLDENTRSQVQSRALGIVGVPTNPAQLANPSVYRSLAQPFEISYRRDSLGLNVLYQATRDIAARFRLNSYSRNGHQPWGASFAFNNANEVALPLDQRTTDFNAGLEWANPRGMLRVAWDGSWFNNAIQVLEWDNPLRATDFNSGVPPFFDPSGYTNGNGPAFGRFALSPSNNLNTVSGMGMLKLPRRSTLNAVLSVTHMGQNEELIPWTSNTLINSPVVLAGFPPLSELPRRTADARVRAYNAAVNFTARPMRLVNFHARYRYNNHDNRTPPFDAREYVRFDAVPEETGDFTHELDIERQQFDANVTFNVLPFTALRVGYGFDKYDRTGRDFVGTTDNTLRVSADVIGNQYLSVRGVYEYTDRGGRGFSKDALEEGGYQEGLRFFDESDRTRNRGTFMVTLTPLPVMDVTASLSATRDRYRGPGHEFGLLDNDNLAYSAGINVMPTGQVAFGVSYAREQYEAMQRARNANPVQGPPESYQSWFDPNRTWQLDNDEKVDSVSIYADILRAIARTDIRVSYDLSDSDNAFIYSGPRISALQNNAILTPGDARPCGTLASCFIPLPDVTNRWHRATVDVRYHFTDRVGIGAAYLFEKFDISDWATVDLPGPNGFRPQTGEPRVDYLGGITTGYGNRPYRANTGFFRVFYAF
jgi:MtrB/PioB family decaheme-associated outer membrane protein